MAHDESVDFGGLRMFLLPHLKSKQVAPEIDGRKAMRLCIRIDGSVEEHATGTHIFGTPTHSNFKTDRLGRLKRMRKGVPLLPSLRN